MSFKVQPIDGDKWELVFTDEPSWVHALKMAPDSMEMELRSGLWLVVTFPVWSAPVRDSVRASLACTKEHGGKFRLGVRPFDSHDEIGRWWPDAKGTPLTDKIWLEVGETGSQRETHISSDSSSNPLWLVLIEGRVVFQGSGPRSKAQLGDLMKGVLNFDEKP